MTPLTPTRTIISLLIASTLLFLMSDRSAAPLPDRNGQHSFATNALDKQNLDRATRTRIEQIYGKLPMRFEANEGQTDERVKFIARGAGYAVFLTGNGAVLQLRRGERKRRE